MCCGTTTSDDPGPRRSGRDRLGDLRRLTPRSWLQLLAASALITINRGVYIFAVTHGHLVDAVLGYFINPLVRSSWAWWCCENRSADEYMVCSDTNVALQVGHAILAAARGQQML